METTYHHAARLSALLLAACAASTANAQFGRTFSSTDVTPPTLNAAYQRAGGSIVILLETQPVNEDAYVIVDGTTGATVAAFRLGRRYGAMPSPDGREIRIAGTEQTSDLQPVYFAGRYDALTRLPLKERQIGVDKDSGYSLVSEVSPDGSFLFRGSHGLLEINLVAKYEDNFVPAWGTALTFEGKFQPLGLETHPLAGGHVGFYLELPEIAEAELRRKNVVGVLDAMTGSLVWSGVVTTRQTAQVLDDLKYVFGDDGSFFAVKKVVSLVEPSADTVVVERMRADGTRAYSREVTVPGAVFEGQYFFGESALLYLSFKEGGADRIQFLVLDGEGQLRVNTVLNCQLRGSGQAKLTAAQRIGTDHAFLRFEAGFGGQSPQQTLARLNLRTGDIELRRLPATTLSGSRFDVVTTPPGDYNSPFNNSAGLPARTTALTSILTQPLGGPGILGLYELPNTGDFPTCLDLGPSPIVVGSSPAATFRVATLLDLSRGATAVSHAMPGMVEPRLRPSVATLQLSESTVCDDDSTPGRPELSIARLAGDRIEIRVPTVGGWDYRLERTLDFRDWAEVGRQAGDGSPWIVEMPITATSAYHRVVAARP